MSTENEIIEDVEIGEDVENASGGGWHPQPKTKCVAQVSPAAETVNVGALTSCCSIIEKKDLVVSTKEVNATIIKGIVKCGSDGNKVVAGAIVVATSSTKNYVGITNNLGEYSIVVPAPGSYSVAAYLVSPCAGDNICKQGACESGCK